MRLSDQVISEICRQLQVAIITGTDVVDNLRMIRLEEKEEVLHLTRDYATNAEANIISDISGNIDIDVSTAANVLRLFSGSGNCSITVTPTGEVRFRYEVIPEDDQSWSDNVIDLHSWVEINKDKRAM